MASELIQGILNPHLEYYLQKLDDNLPELEFPIAKRQLPSFQMAESLGMNFDFDYACTEMLAKNIFCFKQSSMGASKDHIYQLGHVYSIASIGFIASAVSRGRIYWRNVSATTQAALGTSDIKKGLRPIDQSYINPDFPILNIQTTPKDEDKQKIKPKPIMELVEHGAKINVTELNKIIRYFQANRLTALPEFLSYKHFKEMDVSYERVVEIINQFRNANSRNQLRGYEDPTLKELHLATVYFAKIFRGNK